MAGYIGSKSSVTLVDGITKNGGTLEGDLSFGDNDKAKFGAGDDLQIYHDGSKSVIEDSGTGALQIKATDLEIRSSTTNENYIYCVENGAVNLYYNDAQKLATTSTGVDVTGELITTGNVGIGTSSSYPLTVQSGTAGSNHALALRNSSNNFSRLGFLQTDSATAAYTSIDGDGRASGYLKFNTNDTERMRIDSSGNLLVGKTSTSLSINGTALYPNGTSLFTRSLNSGDGAGVAYFQRNTSDGNIIMLYNSSTTHVGSIGTLFGDITIGTSDTGLKFTDSSNVIVPFNVSTNSERDNAIGLGQPSTRFEDAFVTNGVTTGSDANDKQDIATLTDTEMLVAARLSQTFRTYRWKDSVAEKGDNARTHTGTIAQEVQAAFTAEGLDAGDYAMFMSDTWWTHDVDVPAVEAVEAVTETTTDEDGNEVVTVITEAVEAKDAYTRTDTYDTEAEAPEGATSKTRLGIRYPELLSFVAAYNEQRFASIEARLTALEA